MSSIFHYHIQTLIYESPHSLIYQALDTHTQQPVVLKLLKSEYPSPAEQAHYYQEYQILSTLDFPGIIKAYGLKKYNNSPMLILEYCDGESVKKYLQQHRFTVQTFLPLAIQITQIIGNLHQAHIIHKDINANNIIFNPETNQLKLIDFGIATRLTQEQSSLKNPEQIEGTLPYIAPEQTGRINRSIDYRTDLYSLGATFYEILTGQLPFSATEPLELVHCHLAKTPLPPIECNLSIPPLLNELVMKLMAKNAEDRYQSAWGLKYDLEKALNHLTPELTIIDFPLGEQDFSGQCQIPQKLYGRESAIQTLLQAFEQISEGHTELMLITGYSGIGKTALVHEVHKPMTEKRGYFASGKFDQYQRNTPYFALTQAFNSFFDYLLSEPSVQLENWKQAILEAVGTHGQLLIDVFPHLATIIGEQPALPELGATETQTRFNFLCINLLHTIARKEHPFILFIDDLQWADSASLSLLKTLITHTESHYFLLIGAYRDNEVDEAHSLSLWLKSLAEVNVTPHNLHLTSLTMQNINHLMADTLRMSSTEVHPLADLIYTKTQGNPFFSRQFIQTLYEEKLLQFNYESRQWQWFYEKINSKNITDNVITLMTQKISRMPQNTQTLLSIAACIGNQFELSILVQLLQQPVQAIWHQLWQAIEENLIMPTQQHHLVVAELQQAEEINEQANLVLQFIHDQVQQAAYLLIPSNERPVLHLQIARLFIDKNKDLAATDEIFTVVRHFTQARNLLTEEQEIRQLTQLSQLAGRRAKTASAYQTAFEFFEQAISLNQDDWQSDYSFLLSLYDDAAEAAFLSGHIEKMEQLIEIILQHAIHESDKVESYRLLIQKLNSVGQCTQAIELGLKTLKKLGYSIPEVADLSQAIATMKEFNQTIANQVVNFSHLAKMKEETALKAAEIMVSLFPSTFITGRMDVCILLLVHVLKLQNNLGNAPIAPFAYGLYGGFNFIFLNDVKLAQVYGEITLTLLQDPFYLRNKSRGLHMVGFFIEPWVKPLLDSVDTLLEGVESGKEVGDKEFTAYNADGYGIISLWAGIDLSKVKNRIESMLSLTKNQAMQTQFIRLAAYQVAVENLQTFSKFPYKLQGESFNEEIQLPILREKHENTGICYILANKLWLAYLFGEYELCQSLAEEQEQYEMASAGIYIFAGAQFYRGLTLLAQPTMSPAATQKLTAILTNMQFWASTAPMNFNHKYQLLMAEKARLEGQKWQAVEYYESAIANARAGGFQQEVGLANELCAQFWLAQKNEKVAQIYLKEAYYSYQQWGATAKLQQLKEKYILLFQQARSDLSAYQTTFNDTSSQTLLASISQQQLNTRYLLDLNSIVKVSQTLSSEIVLDNLLEKLMTTVMENAGAQRGVLILKKGEKWLIEAESITNAENAEKVTILQALPLETHVPLSIINYVIRSQKFVVLDDVQNVDYYSKDTYFSKHNTHSVLCMPIVYKKQLGGILYLENHITTGTFTPNRVEILSLLSSQIAISLENAQFVKDLEEERQKAEAANRSKTAFLANVSHELRTPLNGILGYTQLFNQQKAIPEHLQKGLQIIERNGEYLLTLINDIIDFSKTESGEIVLQPTDIHLGSFLMELVEIFEERAKNKHLHFVWDFSPALPVGLRADERRLRQILVHLLSNAVKFTKAGTVFFTVCLINHSIRFIVQDSGIGIEEENLERIFSPFEQVEEWIQKSEGAGLGLTLAKKLIDKMRGSLSVSSELDKGSQFTVDIPWIETSEQLEQLDDQAFFSSHAQASVELTLSENEGETNQETALMSILETLSVEQLTVLFELGMSGDFRGLAEKAEEIRQLGEFFMPLADTIRQRADEFDTDFICELVEPLLAEDD